MIFLVLGSIPSVFQSDTAEDELSDYDLGFSAVSWNASDYVNFTGPVISAGGSQMFRIFIDDNDSSRNWSVYASNYSWCTGSGIFSDPYVIENLFVDGNGSDGMIFVKNSDKYFIIRDCWFNFSGPNSSDTGILIQFSSNGMIVDNSFTYTRGGVTIQHLVSNVTVDNNIFISDHTTAGLGVAISIGAQSGPLTVSNNKIRNYYSPMAVFSSANVTLSNNYIETTIWENHAGSPVLCKKVNETQIIRNVLAGGFAFSTFEIINSGGSGNTITNNTVISDEPLTFGPETSLSLKTSQSSRLISLEDSHNNLIAHNVMLGVGAGGSGEVIPGFDIFVLLGTVGVISVLLVIFKDKRR